MNTVKLKWFYLKIQLNIMGLTREESGKYIYLMKIRKGDKMGRLKKYVVGALVMLVSTAVFGAADNKNNVATVQQEVTSEKTEELQQVQSYEQLIALLDQNGHFYEKYDVAYDIGRPNTQDIVTGDMGAAMHSETNTQVSDVDEPDGVKVDDRYIYTCLKGNSVAIVDTKNGMKQVSSIRYDEAKDGIKYKAERIFLDDKYLTVILSSNEKSGFDRRYYYGNYGRYSAIQVYDISDKTNPKLKRQVKVEGGLLAIRKIENQIYLVTDRTIGWFAKDKYSKEEVLPTYKDSVVSEKLQTIDVRNIRYYEWSGCETYTVITSFNIDNTAAAQFNVLMGETDELYMNKDGIFLTETYYASHSAENNETTYITKYDVNRGKVSYASYGKVPGRLLNQFSMDEYEGYFRIATDCMRYDTNLASSGVYVLDKKLNIIGKVEGLAKGENIYSVRFDGTRGYVVTFERVDPLFVIDLSQPNAPKVLGELKVPGFSQYLHPIGNHLVVGIGHSTVENVIRDETGKETVIGVSAAGLKLSLFDVTNPKMPLEINNIILGTKGSWSEALDNHTAIMVDQKKQLLAIPVSLQFEDGVEITDKITSTSFTGAYVFQVENGKLVGKAKLGQIDAITGDYSPQYGYSTGRVCYIGNTIYYIYDEQINAYDIESFKCKEAIVLK